MEYGDAYAIGAEPPYDFYIWTRADIDSGHPEDYWLNIGELSIIGPRGDKGEKGDKGDSGPSGQSTKWISQLGAPTTLLNGKENDQYLDTNTGNVYQYNNGWQLKGNIKGPAGQIGPKGERGERGLIGPVGPKGDIGPAGQTITIIAELEKTNQLPSPYDVPRHYAYLIPDESDPERKILWVIMGSDELVWTDAGTIGDKYYCSVDDGELV